MRRFGILCALWLFSFSALADDAVWRQLQDGGYVLLMRHAQTVPGTGDPPEFSLDECATQRNLSEAGREQAKRTGEAFRQRGIELAEVRSSAWCRCVDTAKLAFGRVTVWPALNSFFGARGTEGSQTAEVLKTVATVKPPENWMLVTHQVNITALTGDWPNSGEIFVARLPATPGGKLEVIGKIKVP
jgi:broad specificity phosphatase PhoE